MVDVTSLVVNLMLSLTSVMSPPPDLCDLSRRTVGGKVMYFGSCCFRSELGLLNCDNICMFVVNKKFDLL